MSSAEDTWKFWSRFVFEYNYVALFIAIRSGNWHLRMAALKLMAADFTAFDHPIYQKLITNHMQDVRRTSEIPENRWLHCQHFWPCIPFCWLGRKSRDAY